jgi:uncharacterized protein YndB with AHSA1/START domain
MKQKFELEYPMHTSPEILFTRLSTPGGLSEWFADDVNLDGKIYTFFWGKTEQQAEAIMRKDCKYIRFRWLEDNGDKTYFEFRIIRDDLTGDVSLLITDFSEEDEKNDFIDLWDTQIAKLKHAIGI